jgi:dihydrofolate reductase
MGKLVVSEFITLDGVATDPGGFEGQQGGGWAFKFSRGDVGDKFKYDELMASDALLLGRVTYEGFAQAWPSRSGDEFSDKFNSMAKYVVSTTLKDPTWKNSTVIGGDVKAAITKLKEEIKGDILVNGSIQLVGTLSELDLVDEYRLMVYPTVIGAGKKLFGKTSKPLGFQMADPIKAGELVILTFVPKRDW